MNEKSGDEIRAEFRARQEKAKAGLTMWERIEECDASPSVKDILRRLVKGET